MAKTTKLNETVIELLVRIRNGELGEVIYKFPRVFEDDYYKNKRQRLELRDEDPFPTQVNPINREIFKDHKGNNTSLSDVYKLFLDTKIDKGALDFYISI